MELVWKSVIVFTFSICFWTYKDFIGKVDWLEEEWTVTHDTSALLFRDFYSVTGVGDNRLESL